MKWARKVSRFISIDIYIHATFLLIIAFVAWSHWIQGLGVNGILEGRLVGLATSENIGEFLMIQATLKRNPGNAAPGSHRQVDYTRSFIAKREGY